LLTKTVFHFRVDQATFVIVGWSAEEHFVNPAQAILMKYIAQERFYARTLV